MAALDKVVSKQGKVTAGELELDIVCSYFGDRVFLLITSVGKIGTLLDVTRDPFLASSSSHTYSVRTLLGKDEAEVHVYGRAIASALDLPPNVPLSLALGLKHHTPSFLQTLLPQLAQFRTWS